MTTETLRLLSLRLTGLLTQGFLLIAGTVLFVFGVLELFSTVTLLALALVWVVYFAVVRARAAHEHVEHRLDSLVTAQGEVRESKAAAGVTAAQYTRLRAVRLRRMARKALELRVDRFDIVQAVLTTLVWLSFLSYMGSVVASA